MWRRPSNQVSPVPWRDNDYNFEEPPRTETASTQNLTRNSVRTGKLPPEKDTALSNGSATHKEPIGNGNAGFVYTPGRKSVKADDLHQFLERRFNKNHAWRPSLTERKR